MVDDMAISSSDESSVKPEADTLGRAADLPAEGEVVPMPPLADVEAAHPVARIRKRDFHFLPIPSRCRHNPNLSVEEQFPFTLSMNLILASAAVSPGRDPR